MYQHDSSRTDPSFVPTTVAASGGSVFGRFLRAAREAAGLTVPLLALRSGVGQRTIEYLEAGRTQVPRRATLLQLARGLSLLGEAQRRFLDGPYELPDDEASIPHNLPYPLSSFIARPQEQRDLARLLHGRSQRLLITLCGPGGIGKTRLAVTVARAVRGRFPGGAFMIDLAPVTAAPWIALAIANALNVRDDNPTSLDEMILGRLRESRTLLLFDNCEHLTAPVATMIARLLGEVPSLQIIATSREPLGLEGELVRRLRPLALPPAPRADGAAEEQLAAIAESAAVQLFLARAQLVRPTFALTSENAVAVAAICRRLDGLPLAIELAASRLYDLPIATLAADLAVAVNSGGRRRGVPQRQRTLDALLDWSYALLNDAERTLLRRLAIFAGSWTVDAAIAVCGDERIPDLPQLLRSLVAKSLVQRGPEIDGDEGPERFAFLETVRQYAREKLRSSGELPLAQRRLCDWAIGVLESVESPLDGGAEGAAWLAYVGAELTNLRAARAWALEHEPASALRLISATWPYAFARLGHDAGRYLLREALDAAPGPSPWRGRALQGLGFLNLFNNLPAAQHYLAEALRLAEEAGDSERIRALRWQLAFASVTVGDVAAAEEQVTRGRPAIEADPRPGRRSPYHIVAGYIAIARGDFITARAEFLAAESTAREAEQPLFRCVALSRLGALHLRYGHLDMATENYTALLALARSLGSWFYRFLARSGLAHVREWADDHEAAEVGYLEALTIAVESGGSRLDRATILLGRGRVALRQRRPEAALALLEEGHALAVELKHRSLINDFAGPLGFALWRNGQTARAAAQLDAALDANASGDPTTLARCLDSIALLAIESGETIPALGWFAAVDGLRAAIQMHIRPAEQALRDAARSVLASRGEGGQERPPSPPPLTEAIAQAHRWLVQIGETARSSAYVPHG
jgi:predicted ATPase